MSSPIVCMYVCMEHMNMEHTCMYRSAQSIYMYIPVQTRTYMYMLVYTYIYHVHTYTYILCNVCTVNIRECTCQELYIHVHTVYVKVCTRIDCFRGKHQCTSLSTSTQKHDVGCINSLVRSRRSCKPP